MNAMATEILPESDIDSIPAKVRPFVKKALALGFKVEYSVDTTDSKRHQHTWSIVHPSDLLGDRVWIFWSAGANGGRTTPLWYHRHSQKAQKLTRPGTFSVLSTLAR